MLPDRPVPGSAADWLRHARSDLALASVTSLPQVLYNQLCFHAQQAVEKSIKAVLIHHNVEFRKVHDIDYLMTMLPPDVSLPPEAEQVVGLTGYAVMLRYPGDYEDLTEEEYRETIQIAQAVVTWAERIICETEN
ncbi:MAG TPA: HEPN domain-containing protein [Chloroflexi bacterium]|nr:HEPN domain-containing protein [Chloroflexota bacterium]